MSPGGGRDLSTCCLFNTSPELPSFFLSAHPSPTFSLFSWHTCLLGVASCLLMMFLISPGAAGGSLLLMGLLSALLTARGGPSSWGYVSQALLFHQVGGACGKGLGRQSVKAPCLGSWCPVQEALKGGRPFKPFPRTTSSLFPGAEVPAPPGRPEGACEILAAPTAAPGGEPPGCLASAEVGQPAQEGRALCAGPCHPGGPW